MADEEVVEQLDHEPTGAELAKEFAEQADEPAAEPVAEPTAEIPTVPDEAEVVEPPAQQFDREYFEKITAGYAALAEQQRQELEQLRNAQRQTSNVPVKPAGFDVNEWKKLVEQDPVKAIQMAALHDPKFTAMEQRLQAFEQAEQQRQTEAFARRVDAQAYDVQVRYPNFKPGTPEYQATYQFVQANAAWLKQVAQSNANFNPIEHAYKVVSHDLLAQKNKVQSQKLVDKRSKSVTVRPGATTPVVPSGTSAARAAAADLATKGSVIPDSWVEAAERAEKKFA
jgi:hypothetical protein